MIRESIISIYLFVFKILFILFKWFPIKNKVSFVISFSENNKYVYNEIKRQNMSCEIVFLCKGKCIQDFAILGEKTIPFETLNIRDMVFSAYHLATSKVIFIDNYFGFLASISLRHEVECIQLWHAAGAIKTFGLMDQSIKSRPTKAKKRFIQVYQKFSKVVVGSDNMAEIFMRAFGLTEERILRTGVPRTDFFYNEANHLKANVEKSKFKGKKVILYAPTFRDGELEHFDLHLNLQLMKEYLSEEYVLLLRLHPAIHTNLKIDKTYEAFIYNYSSWPNINELLLITDVLITDYSSIPYEFSHLERPMIFFPYDLEEYQRLRGLWDNYKNLVPGPVVFTTEGIIECLKNYKEFNMNEIKNFSKQWNMYSKGISSQNIVNYIKNRLG
ncbi:CDP-glycerol glycerophosphotransferase family protein [Terrilactibacillus laevilacticus]|uniref:CDP-glycerol glycerophosphotransferase family protein n=1 Tax=Terrilactibacillus laevilacticus TaxID=1380157 RepID=UPI00114704AD|nr:CDP-glycerol glycerophosphotransferase family protein [Terrilactibacillus laevilacticus]